jgi:hypothetical protein
MMNGIRKCFLAWQIRRRIKLATEVIYSEKFDLNALVRNLVPNNKSLNLLCAYIAIRFAADTKLGREIQMDDVLRDIRSSEVLLNEPETCQSILELRKTEAEVSLLKAEIEIATDRLAPEYSYKGIIYRAEKAKKGPLSHQERQQLKVFSEQLNEVERKIEDATNRPEEDTTSEKDA